MKKLFMLFTALVLTTAMFQTAEAKTMQVTALEDFNTNNPPRELHVQMNGNARMDYDLMLFLGYQVTGKIVPLASGGFVFVPVNYVNYQEEQLPITKEFPAKYKGRSGIIRQNQPFNLVFPDNEPENFQYYVPSTSDMN